MKQIPQQQFTPEQELLFWSIRVDHSKDKRAAEILSAGIDWNYVRETAIQHGIIPLLYKRLKEEMSDFVPPKELEELRTLFMANAVRNLRMTQLLIKVLDLLADSGIQAIPFKGPVLAVQAYGDLSMRSFNDLDILIKKTDFDLVYDILIKNGYDPEFMIDSRVKKQIILRKKDMSFSGHGIFLEIHLEIFERYLSVSLNPVKLWDMSYFIYLNGYKIKTILPEDLLIILCIHATKHYWDQLKWLADISQLIEHTSTINWARIFKQCDELGLKRIIILNLLLIKENCGLKLDPDIISLFGSDEDIIDLEKPKNFFNQDSEKLFFAFPIFYLGYSTILTTTS